MFNSLSNDKYFTIALLLMIILILYIYGANRNCIIEKYDNIFEYKPINNYLNEFKYTPNSLICKSCY